MLLGTFLPAETSWSQVGHFLWVLALGASPGTSSGHFLWAVLLVMLLAMLLAALLQAFLALPANAPGDLPASEDLLVPR